MVFFLGKLTRKIDYSFEYCGDYKKAIDENNNVTLLDIKGWYFHFYHIIRVIKKNIKQTFGRIKKNDKKPTLCVIQVGENPASTIYVNRKHKVSKEIGINSIVKRNPAGIKEDELLKVIEKLNDDKEITGILVQLPLPSDVNENKIIEAVDCKKDVDGFSAYNISAIAQNKEPFVYPCTPKGVIKILEEYNISLEGKHVVVIGRSNIVGKPMAQMLLKRNATRTETTVCAVQEIFPVVIALWFHLFPFRTEKLSTVAPMVLRKRESRSPPSFRRAPRQRCPGARRVFLGGGRVEVRKGQNGERRGESMNGSGFSDVASRPNFSLLIFNFQIKVVNLRQNALNRGIRVEEYRKKGGYYRNFMYLCIVKNLFILLINKKY